jgi:hypothetical protein
MISKARIYKQKNLIREIRKGTSDDFFIGYEKALLWVLDHYNFKTCPLKRNICSKKSPENCSRHFRCKDCGCNHTRGSNELEKENIWDK